MHIGPEKQKKETFEETGYMKKGRSEFGVSAVNPTAKSQRGLKENYHPDMVKIGMRRK